MEMLLMSLAYFHPSNSIHMAAPHSAAAWFHTWLQTLILVYTAVYTAVKELRVYLLQVYKKKTKAPKNWKYSILKF